MGAKEGISLLRPFISVSLCLCGLVSCWQQVVWLLNSTTETQRRRERDILFSQKDNEGSIYGKINV